MPADVSKTILLSPSPAFTSNFTAVLSIPRTKPVASLSNAAKGSAKCPPPAIKLSVPPAIFTFPPSDIEACVEESAKLLLDDDIAPAAIPNPPICPAVAVTVPARFAFVAVTLPLESSEKLPASTVKSLPSNFINLEALPTLNLAAPLSNPKKPPAVVSEKLVFLTYKPSPPAVESNLTLFLEIAAVPIVHPAINASGVSVIDSSAFPLPSYALKP